MRRGDLVLADASSAPEWWSDDEAETTEKMLVVLIEPLPDVDGWRCYSPKYKSTYSFWEFELEAR